MKIFKSKSAENFSVKVWLKIKNQGPFVKSSTGLPEPERTAHNGDPIAYVIFQSKSGKNFSIRVRLKIKNQSPVEKRKSGSD
jgi:hypothetical protein